MFSTVSKRFRIISYLEGLSYFILVFIAMPLKYLGNHAEVLKSLGMIHGALFMLFCIALFQYGRKYKFKKSEIFDFFLYSLYPFGFLLIENSLKEKTDI